MHFSFMFFLFGVLSSAVAATFLPSGIKHTLAFNMRGGSQDGINAMPRKVVLIIDVDNTLYSEDLVKNKNGVGIESQIVKNTHNFCQEKYGLTQEDCDTLYHKFGSTVEGLRSYLIELNKAVQEENELKGSSNDFISLCDSLADYYSSVYDPINFSPLLESMSYANRNGADSKTGYSHVDEQKIPLNQMLSRIPYPVYLASNSPKNHILRVLSSMSLKNVKFEGILSPDVCTSSEIVDDVTCFPSKSNPTLFYKEVLRKYPPKEYDIFLLDDSLFNLKKAQEVGIYGVLIANFPREESESACSLEEGVGLALGHFSNDAKIMFCPTNKHKHFGAGIPYTFSDVEYLASKNEVDKNSINPDVWKRLMNELSSLDDTTENEIFNICDLGSGLLSMLQLFMNGRAAESHLEDLPSIFESLSRIRTVNYFAYEPNHNLLERCQQNLEELGFELVSTTSEEDNRTAVDAFSYSTTIVKDDSLVQVNVFLRMKDFREDQNGLKQRIHLIVGCCFADLFHPQDLVREVQIFLKRGKGLDGSHLMYFPITFCGTTSFFPPAPLDKARGIPSDTEAFRIYGQSLISRLGHNTDINRITEAVVESGGELVCSGFSNWIVKEDVHAYLHHTLMYFFGASGAADMMIKGWNATGWIDRALRLKPIIQVTNKDLLYRLPSKGDSFSQESESHSYVDDLSNGEEYTTTINQIQFRSPRNVTKIEKSWDPKDLGPMEVQIESICSLISSGTELKIFKGQFEEAALDVNIKGMTDESMAYPLAYGYCLVGKVKRCGSKVPNPDQLIGKNVFVFAAHADCVVSDVDAIQIIPDGILPEDAIFFPSVETALSLVHDAHIRLGENSAVFGQGLIGLLVTALLSMTGGGTSVSAFDTLPDRLAASSVMGASQALFPSQASLEAAGPFDVSIEVSGNARALQSAIDHTRSGGRVVIGSWYGSDPVELKLGIDFHRSHKTLITSQVSEIPAALTALWNKKRRFDLTWDIVKQLRPSRTLVTRRVGLHEAQSAYELLEKGKEIAIMFQYKR